MSASLSLYDKEHAAREKYIYFLCGVAGALFAYLGKDYKPNHPWTTQDSLTVSTLSCFVASFLCGIGRILFYIQGISTNREALEAREEVSNYVMAKTQRVENAEKGLPLSFNKKTGNALTYEDILAGIKASKAIAENHEALMKRWFKFSTASLVACHVLLIAGFVLMILAKSFV